MLAGLGALTAPPPARAVTAAEGPVGVRGAFHVHTTRSDGGGDLPAVAAAAARAGLQVVVVTDHGDATRPPEAPAYVEGVLVIDAVEISSFGGHVVALGLGPAPYPLAGETRAVVEDVQRFGGLAIAAHPGSAREELAWRAGALPVDGVEWINADSSWRDEHPLTLALTALRYPFRPTEAMARLLDRPEEPLGLWGAWTADRRVTALPAVDAHGRLGPGGDGGGPGLPVPSYESAFRLLSFGLDGVSLTGEPAADAAAVIDAVRGGRVFSVVDGLATPGTLRLSATAGDSQYRSGDLIDPGVPLELRVAIDGPADARLELLRDGEVLAGGPGPELRYTTAGDPGVYRAEAHLPDAPGAPPVPWMLSNPIYVRTAGPARDGAPATVANAELAPEIGNWRIEASPGSQGAIDQDLGLAGEPVTLLRYAVSGRASASPYVAFAVPVAGLFETRDRVGFSVRADRPMRVDIQVRTPTPQPGGEVGERWHRSVWADTTGRDVVVRLDEILPRGPTREARPDPAAIDSLLFVVDTVNTPVGTGGRIWVSNLVLGTAP